MPHHARVSLLCPLSVGLAVKPPVVPKVHFDGDTSNFDEYPETDWKAARLLDEIELQLFDNF